MPSSLDFDLYETLEVARDASAQEITASYRRLARFHHPDKNLDNADATAKFQKVQAAYEVLSDEDQRRVYDEPEFSSGFGGGSAWGHPQAYYDSSDDDLDDVEEMIFNLFFQDMFARASSRQGSFRNPQSYTEMERREREARNREEAGAQKRKEKAAADAVKHAKRKAETESKKAMEKSAAEAKEKAEMQSRLKMENIFASYSCVTELDKQACCEHCLFWPKEQMKRKFKCLNCGQKRVHEESLSDETA
ncbi:hypothetical protein EYC84_007309 [Monilinia fructicola]|uniref:J domain-containing protein n=1 Tax=Monilinia fructicola TaxID=38448 RepID=A0A5M9K8Y8_MONFR|nr:hypothetical protein EYC84_007309 [Monilinia fructicola]